jgi:hypothetical protein
VVHSPRQRCVALSYLTVDIQQAAQQHRAAHIQQPAAVALRQVKGRTAQSACMQSEKPPAVYCMCNINPSKLSRISLSAVWSGWMEIRSI